MFKTAEGLRALCLFRYREVALPANARYLDALAAVDDPTPGKPALQRLAATRSLGGPSSRRQDGNGTCWV